MLLPSSNYEWNKEMQTNGGFPLGHGSNEMSDDGGYDENARHGDDNVCTLYSENVSSLCVFDYKIIGTQF